MSVFHTAMIGSLVDPIDSLSDSKPRLIFLNRCYWPDSEATGQLLTDLCESLASAFDVHVICGLPNSPTTNCFVEKGIETRNGVVIHRLRHTRFAKRVPAGRLINLVSFTAATQRYLRRTKLDARIIISETDPFLLPMVAANHSRRIGSKLVCYLQDIYPDVAEEIGKVRTGWLTNQIRQRLRKAYVAADRIVVLGECMRNRLRCEPWSLESDKLSVIPNWADCESIRPQPTGDNELRQREGIDDRFLVMHSGNMGLTQRLEALIEATKSVHWPDKALLLLVGDGAARAQLQAQAAKNESDRVRFLPYQPRAELATSLSAADLHVVSMHEQITGCLCPSKLYGILAAGRPLLAIASEATDLCQTVTTHGLGWCCRPGDPAGIAKAVANAAENSGSLEVAGKNARALACRHFDRPVVLERFQDLLRDILNERPESIGADQRRNVVRLQAI